ncbi:hypothetical protein V2G26_009629 [Clonostachys chloroleuca]
MRSPFSLVALGAFLSLTHALDLPGITLPWRKYQAEVFADDEKIFLFKNVRFGKEPPRFGAPSFPDWEDDSIQSPEGITTYVQINMTALRNRSWGSALQASNYSSIFIAGNYRVGAFGWLAGDYMQRVGQPNAGLYDQALLFEWVQKYIDQVHGDKENFSRLAGCEFAYDIDCLRQAPVQDLAQANTQLFNLVYQTGLFPVGPSTDSKWIKNLSPISISEGKYWKNIQSSIISHVSNEGDMFAPMGIDSEAKFDAFPNEFLPAAIITHAVFTCNTRDLATAYPDVSYMMEYGFPIDKLACHATDLFSMFFANATEIEKTVEGS